MWIAKDDGQPMRTGSMSADAVRGVLRTIFTTLRVMVYSVMALLEPLIVWGAMAAALIGIALVVFFGLIVRAPHFPSGLVLTLIGGSGLALVAYYALMAMLLPED